MYNRCLARRSEPLTQLSQFDCSSIFALFVNHSDVYFSDTKTTFREGKFARTLIGIKATKADEYLGNCLQRESSLKKRLKT